MRVDGLPLTYAECRARFRRTCQETGTTFQAYPIDATGPDGGSLSVDIAQVGSPDPSRVLVVLSGVHGVEGFAGSAAQCRLLARLAGTSLPGDAAVVLVHAVNPWGMAWWRRQNESNVDLNRNWARERIVAPANPGYVELHGVLCPDDDELPTSASFLEPISSFVDQRGIQWVRHAVSAGQYTHPDGLYFGGERTEPSTRVLEQVTTARLADVTRAVLVDLHTGHGPYGEGTILCDHGDGSPQHRWLEHTFPGERVEVTGERSAVKVGQLAHGMARLIGDGDHHSFTVEVGTVRNTRMILAERAEHWVHRRGDRTRPDHIAAVWEHRICSTPDDPDWERSALEVYDRVIDAAVASVTC